MKFLIPDAALRQHVIALGKTRSGKSSKMRLIIEHFLDQKIPVCIIDPKGDWWGIKLAADGKHPGYPLVIFGTEHARYADIRINIHSGAPIAELVATGNRPCLIDLKGMRVGERARFFIDFASSYFKHARGERILAIDECHNFVPQGKIPDPQTGEMLHWANRLISEGGGMGITMFSASQRPQKVHKDYVTSHETLIATRVIHKLDRDAIKDWIDACGDPDVGKEVMNSLAAMQRTEAWVYSPEAGFGPERMTFPMFKTFDSFKPQSDKVSRRLRGWAAIDLKEIEEKLVKVVEEAKANDPKTLKTEIATLKRELATIRKQPLPGLDPASVQEAERRGYGVGYGRGKIDGYADALTMARGQIGDLLVAIDAIPIATLRQTVLQIDKWAARAAANPPKVSAVPVMPQRLNKIVVPVIIPGKPGIGQKTMPASETGTVKPIVRKILDSIHRAFPMALSFEAAALRAAVSRRSSAYRLYRRDVEESVEIERREDGRFQSAPGYADPIATGSDPVETFAARLPNSYAAMLRAIASAGRALGKDEIATAANVSPTSSGLSSGLRELLALSLIEKDGEGYALHKELAA